MTTNSINWNYQSWEEAFKALVPAVRQQSVRVASYTQVLYAQACASSFSKQWKEGAIRISAKNVELAYKCALYHQIGKALLPPELQVWRNDFTEHERATYRMYTTNGRILVSKLQERTDRFPKHTTEFTEVPTDNIAWLMIRETAQQHMERWEGGGYPEQRKGTDISAIAQVVGLAKEIDRLCSEVKSESPFEDAMTALVKESDRGFCKELIEVMQACRGQLKAVYRKYIQYTKTLPKTIPLVEKRENRPMGLLYRPMIRGTEGFVAAYEAVPWFKGNLSKEGTDTLYEVSELLKRTELIDDMTFYLLYEAADTVLRFHNCKLPFEGILVPMLEQFYTTGNKMPRVKQLFEDQPIDKRMLIFSVPMNVLVEMDEQTEQFIVKLIDTGVSLNVDEYDPSVLSMETLTELGIYSVRFKSSLYLSTEIANVMTVMRNNGFRIIGGDANSDDIVTWLNSCGATFMSGTATGDLIDEESLIKDLIAKEQDNG